jgi:ABC-2 type transport system permease protein
MTIADAHERGGLGGSPPRGQHSTTDTAARAPQEPALPSAWRIGLARTGVELKAFFREKQSVVFVFTMPAIMLLLLGSIFRNEGAGHGVSVGALFAAGLIGGGVMATSFQYMGISIAIERDRDLLKRLRGTPMPASAYFIGKTGLVLVSTLAETLILVVVGMLVDHLRLPATADRWWTLIWVFTLGTIACSLLGIAASSIPRSARSATAAITLPFVILQFISGVYVPFEIVPTWLRDVAAIFPLKWICQGLRSVFLPSQAAVLEPAGTWEHGRIALVLGAWIVAGLVLCLTTFRWTRRRDG